jgi:hypothetical protein
MMKRNLSQRILEALNTEINVEDGVGKNELELFFQRIDDLGCKQWFKTQVEDFIRSHHSNALSKERSHQRSFLQGSVYGYISGKTGDVRFAVEAGKMALLLADKHSKHTV